MSFGKSACLEAVRLYHEGIDKRGACRFRGADEVGDRVGSGFNHAVAQPTQPTRMLDSVFMDEAEIFADVCAHRIGVQVDKCRRRQRCLTGSRQPMIKIFTVE
jgi:hypothetical protein